jgi:hypothetical protein
VYYAKRNRYEKVKEYSWYYFIFLIFFPNYDFNATLTTLTHTHKYNHLRNRDIQNGIIFSASLLKVHFYVVSMKKTLHGVFSKASIFNINPSGISGPTRNCIRTPQIVRKQLRPRITRVCIFNVNRYVS